MFPTFIRPCNILFKMLHWYYDTFLQQIFKLLQPFVEYYTGDDEMSTMQPIRDITQVRALIDYYNERNNPRNHLLVLMSLHTALRIGDLLRLTWQQVYDFDNNRPRSTLTITEQKTGKNKTIALNAGICDVLGLYSCDARPERFLFANGMSNRAISRAQAYRIIRAASEALGFETHCSCHSLRKTFGYHAWKNGVSPAVIMEIYNHSSLAITRRYLGVAQSDLNEVYMGLEF